MLTFVCLLVLLVLVVVVVHVPVGARDAGSHRVPGLSRVVAGLYGHVGRLDGGSLGPEKFTRLGLQLLGMRSFLTNEVSWFSLVLVILISLLIATKFANLFFKLIIF